jgi:pectinesterase
MLVEHSYFESAADPLVSKDPASVLVARDNVFKDTVGRQDSTGATVDLPYSYRADPADRVPGLVRALAGPRAKPAAPHRELTVALDGSGDFGSVGAAIGAVPNGYRKPVTITVKPGVYREMVRVWADRRNITLRGSTGRVEDVVITYDLASGAEKFYGGTQGSFGSPTLAIYGDDITVKDLTVENSYDESVTPSQALAVRTVGDRAIFTRTRFLGNQDTYKADTPDKSLVRRAYLRDCYIEGDVDFVYGRGTAVFDGCTLKSVDRGTPANNGYVTAASTTVTNPYGFLFTRSRFESDAAAKSVYLGRPWHPSGDPEAIAQVVIRDSWLGAHIMDAPWTDMSGFPWREARFFEHGNRGPGATVTPDRPQLPGGQSRDFEADDYLRGSDGWAPHRR